MDSTPNAYGFWTVVGDAPSRRGSARVEVRCVCGKVRVRELCGLRSGRSKSCGCRQKARVVVTPGDSFGDLVVLRDLSSQGDKHRSIEVRCSCGGIAEVLLENLTSRRQGSCGCQKGNTTHGLSGSPEHQTWRSMLSRCTNPNDVSWTNYGGRGIEVCPRWLHFDAFYEDMGPRPSGHTIDRKDTNGDYTPANCRWATMREQGANKRGTLRLEMDGRTQTIMDWSAETGLPARVIRRRIRRGWEPHRALTQPYQNKSRH